jgi:hypothetical protein
LVEGVQADLTKLKRYFTANKLTYNANKIFPDIPPLFQKTSPIKRVNEVNYLGLYMDEQLNFKQHIEFSGKSPLCFAS